VEDVPESLDVPGAPYAPPAPVPVLPEVPLLLVPLSGVMLEEPLLPLSIPLEPEEELPLREAPPGIVVVPESPLPYEDPEDVAPLLGEVPTDCPNVAVTVPTKDRKMARGNFFIFAPFALSNFSRTAEAWF